MESSVGMSDASRGLFDWTWNPSGSATFNATRTVLPALTPSLSVKRRDLGRNPAQLRRRGRRRQEDGSGRKRGDMGAEHEGHCLLR